MHVRVICITTLLALFLCDRTRVNAEVVARYDFEGNDYVANPSNQTGFNTGLNLSSSAFEIAGITVGRLQFSPELDATAALGFAADEYDDALGFSSDANSDRNFNTANQVVYFDVAVHSGFRLNLESLNFDSLKTRGNDATGARVTHTIFVNPAGDPSNDGLIGDFDFVISRAHDHSAAGQPGAESSGDPFSTGRWSAGPIGLGGKENLTGSNRIALRLYGSDGVDQDFGIDNLVLIGRAVAIPEPGGLFAMLLGAMGLTYRRRPRHFHA